MTEPCPECGNYSGVPVLCQEPCGSGFGDEVGLVQVAETCGDAVTKLNSTSVEGIVLLGKGMGVD